MCGEKCVISNAMDLLWRRVKTVRPIQVLIYLSLYAFLNAKKSPRGVISHLSFIFLTLSRLCFFFRSAV